MVSIQGFKRPLDGSGSLFYYPSTPDDVRQPPLLFRFVSRDGWAGDGPAPFGWRLIEPVGELLHPILDLVAGRDVEIVPPAEYDRPTGPDASTRYPFVRVFRPQVAGTIPQEDGAFDADRILGNTDTVYGTTQRTRPAGALAHPGIHRFLVTHLPLSNQGKLRGKPIFVATNELAHYQVEVRVKNIWKPVTYWMQIADDPKTLKSHTALIGLYVDRNVKITNLLMTEADVRLEVFRLFLASYNERSLIPYFANNLRVSQGGWPRNYLSRLESQKEERIRNERPDGYWWKQFVHKAEDLVGILPIVGDVYDIGATAYMTVAGKAPWTGERVPRGAAVVYAAAAIGPISVSELRRFDNFGRNLPNELAKLSNDSMRDGLERALGPDFALSMAAVATDESIRALKLRLLDVTTQKMRVKDFAEYFSKLLAEQADISTLDLRFAAMQNYTTISKLFKSTTTLEEPLLSEYKKYLLRRHLTTDDVSALEWCLHQRVGKSARVIAEALGANYAGKLRVLAGSGPRAVRKETIEAAARSLAGGNHVDNYSALCKRTRALSPVTERDHIFEQRFFLNNPDFSESMDIEEMTLAVLVPANQEYLRILRGVDPKLRVEYTHADKRPLMQRLPDGRENEFPLQAIWDVHIDTYRQLGVKVSPNGESFGANVYRELVYNLDYLAGDLLEQAKILTAKGLHERAGFLRRQAEYRKRFDPKDRAFRRERFERPGWWEKADS